MHPRSVVPTDCALTSWSVSLCLLVRSHTLTIGHYGRGASRARNRVRRGRRLQHTGRDSKRGCASPSLRALPSTRLRGTTPALGGRVCTYLRVHRASSSSRRTCPSTLIRIRDGLCRSCTRAPSRNRETSDAHNQGPSPGRRLHVRLHGRRQRRPIRLRLHDLRPAVAVRRRSAWTRLQPRMHTPTRTQQGEDFDSRPAWNYNPQGSKSRAA
jgi:hypothetical protein